MKETIEKIKELIRQGSRMSFSLATELKGFFENTAKPKESYALAGLDKFLAYSSAKNLVTQLGKFPSPKSWEEIGIAKMQMIPSARSGDQAVLGAAKKLPKAEFEKFLRENYPAEGKARVSVRKPISYDIDSIVRFILESNDGQVLLSINSAVIKRIAELKEKVKEAIAA